MLRTQMVQNSFEASQIEMHITQLTQDVEDDQAKLDELDASLPSKAEEMGMVPQKGALTIDLNGYQANASGDKTGEPYPQDLHVLPQEPVDENHGHRRRSGADGHHLPYPTCQYSTGQRQRHGAGRGAKRTTTVTLKARRGKIMDTNGAILAQSVERYTIIGNPEQAQAFIPTPAPNRPAATATRSTASRSA